MYTGVVTSKKHKKGATRSHDLDHELQSTASARSIGTQRKPDGSYLLMNLSRIRFRVATTVLNRALLSYIYQQSPYVVQTLVLDRSRMHFTSSMISREFVLRYTHRFSLLLCVRY
jgi:hypothetical protein